MAFQNQGLPPVREDTVLNCLRALMAIAEAREGEKEEEDRLVPYGELFDILSSVYGLPKDIKAQDPYPRGATQAAAKAVAGQIWIDSADETLKMGV